MAFLEFRSKIGRKVRIWLDELPSAALLPNEATRETHAIEGGTATAPRRCAAIEVSLPSHACSYGLLGRDFQPAHEPELKVSVPASTPVLARPYPDSLAGSWETVTIGGLPEYATGICAGLRKVPLHERPSGVLNLTCMAHGDVGSSSLMFS